MKELLRNMKSKYKEYNKIFLKKNKKKKIDKYKIKEKWLF